MIDIRMLSNAYHVRRIREEDIPAVLELCLGNPLYYEHCPPHQTYDGIKEELAALPPGKGYEDKHYIGFFEGETLAAVMDLIDGYPDENTAFIGFFMMHNAKQGKGIGSSIIRDVCRYLSQSFHHVRLGYVTTNEQSKAFWLKNGFVPTGVIAKQQHYDIAVLQREL